MPANPHILFLCAPLFSLFLLYATFSSARATKPNSSSKERQCRDIAPYIAWFSLSLLSALAGAIGVANDRVGGQETRLILIEAILLSLIKTERTCF